MENGERRGSLASRRRMVGEIRNAISENSATLNGRELRAVLSPLRLAVVHLLAAGEIPAALKECRRSCVDEHVSTVF